MKQKHLWTIFGLIICGLAGISYYMNKAHASVCFISGTGCGHGEPLQFAPVIAPAPSCPAGWTETGPNTSSCAAPKYRVAHASAAGCYSTTCSCPSSWTETGINSNGCAAPKLREEYPVAAGAGCFSNECFCPAGWTEPGPNTSSCAAPKYRASHASAAGCYSTACSCPIGWTETGPNTSSCAAPKYRVAHASAAGCYSTTCTDPATLPGGGDGDDGDDGGPEPCDPEGRLYSTVNYKQCNGLFGMVRDTSVRPAKCGMYDCVRSNCQDWAKKEIAKPMPSNGWGWLHSSIEYYAEKGMTSAPQAVKEFFDGVYFCEVKMDCTAGSADCPWKKEKVSGTETGREYLDNTQNSSCNRVCRGFAKHGEPGADCSDNATFTSLKKYNFSMWAASEMISNPSDTCYYYKNGNGYSSNFKITSTDPGDGRYIASDEMVGIGEYIRGITFTRTKKEVGDTSQKTDELVTACRNAVDACNASSANGVAFKVCFNSYKVGGVDLDKTFPHCRKTTAASFSSAIPTAIMPAQKYAIGNYSTAFVEDCCAREIHGFLGFQTRNEVKNALKTAVGWRQSSGIFVYLAGTMESSGIPLCHGNCQFYISSPGTQTVLNCGSNCTTIKHIVNDSNSGTGTSCSSPGAFWNSGCLSTAFLLDDGASRSSPTLTYSYPPFRTGVKFGQVEIKGKAAADSTKVGLQIKDGFVEFSKLILSNTTVNITSPGLAFFIPGEDNHYIANFRSQSISQICNDLTDPEEPKDCHAVINYTQYVPVSNATIARIGNIEALTNNNTINLTSRDEGGLATLYLKQITDNANQVTINLKGKSSSGIQAGWNDVWLIRPDKACMKTFATTTTTLTGANTWGGWVDTTCPAAPSGTFCGTNQNSSGPCGSDGTTTYAPYKCGQTSVNLRIHYDSGTSITGTQNMAKTFYQPTVSNIIGCVPINTGTTPW